MHFYEHDRIALIIDGANLYSASKALGFDVDFKRLLSFFRDKAKLVRAFYFTTVIEEQDYLAVRPLIDWLDYNGYTVITKPVREILDSSGRRKRSSVDVEITVESLMVANFVDHLVLFSGDGDFRSLVTALQQQGKRVTVVSSLRTQPPVVADDLRRQSDQFIDLADLEAQISKPRVAQRSI